MSAFSPTVFSVPINPSNPTNIFHKFLDLPTELRLMVWKWASLQPRIVHVRMEAIIRGTGIEAVILRGREFTSNNTVPAVLQASLESRTEAFKWYTLDMCRYWTWKQKTVYFNHAVDTLYFEVGDSSIMHLPLKELLFERTPDGYEEKPSTRNKVTDVERLAVNLEETCVDAPIARIDKKWSENLKDMVFFLKLQELVFFHVLDGFSLFMERGDIVGSELDKELNVRVDSKKRTNAELQAMMEEAVRKAYSARDEWRNRRDMGYEPPQVRIMQIMRLPRAW